MDNQGMIAALSDAELLANTRGLIGRSNQVFAALLAHLGEVEARGLHRTRACSSMYAYCIYELRLSEDEAVRRVAAARLVRRFPALLDAVAAGELHLKKDSTEPPKPAGSPSRHIPARIRRSVFDRDGARCTHVDASGQRCRETHHLELHHLVPYARGGVHTAENITLRCAAHNAYAAELDFGPEPIATRRDARAHESFRRATNPRAE
jgi:hypothetical protein